MKLGFVLPNNWGLDDPLEIIELARRAEDLGFDSVWVNHHVINVGYIGERLGDRPYYDALTVLAWVGAATSRVRLGTSVLVMPYLHPMVTAKSLATIDRLSGGRVIAGLGVGSLAEENEILGVPFEGRGPWSDEFIEVMKALWAPGAASHDGDNWSFTDVVASPKPAQPELPIWIGGAGAIARRRAARVGQGWQPMCSVGSLGRKMPDLIEQLDKVGRTRSDIVVAPRILDSAVADRAMVEAWAEAGADELIVGTASPDVADIRRSLEHVATLVD